MTVNPNGIDSDTVRELERIDLEQISQQTQINESHPVGLDMTMYYRSEEAVAQSYGPEIIPWHLYNNVILSSVYVGANGDIDDTSRTAGSFLLHRDNFVLRARAAGVIPLMGLLEDPNQAFITQYTTPSEVAGLASKIVSYCQLHNFSGIDLDWENGVIDSQWKELITCLRAEWPTMYISAFAGTGGRLKVIAVQDSLTRINLGVYDAYQNDYQGLPQDITWHNAAVRWLGELLGKQAAEGDVWYYNANGADLSKINLTVPFWVMIQTDDNLQTEPDQLTVNRVDTPSTYRELVDSIHWGETHKWDDVWKASYIADTTNNAFVSYPSPQSMQEYVKLAKEHGLGGISTFANHEEYRVNDMDKFPLSSALRDAIGSKFIQDQIDILTNQVVNLQARWDALALALDNIISGNN